MQHGMFSGHAASTKTTSLQSLRPSSSIFVPVTPIPPTSTSTLAPPPTSSSYCSCRYTRGRERNVSSLATHRGHSAFCPSTIPRRFLRRGRDHAQVRHRSLDLEPDCERRERRFLFHSHRICEEEADCSSSSSSSSDSDSDDSEEELDEDEIDRQYPERSNSNRPRSSSGYQVDSSIPSTDLDRVGFSDDGNVTSASDLQQGLNGERFTKSKVKHTRKVLYALGKKLGKTKSPLSHSFRTDAIESLEYALAYLGEERQGPDLTPATTRPSEHVKEIKVASPSVEGDVHGSDVCTSKAHDHFSHGKEKRGGGHWRKYNRDGWMRRLFFEESNAIHHDVDDSSDRDCERRNPPPGRGPTDPLESSTGSESGRRNASYVRNLAPECETFETGSGGDSCETFAKSRLVEEWGVGAGGGVERKVERLMDVFDAKFLVGDVGGPDGVGVGRGKMYVCLGKSCKKNGSKNVLKGIMESNRNPNVQRVPCKCLGRCKYGPNVKMTNGDQSVLVSLSSKSMTH